MKRRNDRRRRPSGEHEQSAEWVVIEGRHPVAEAIRAGREIREVLIDEGTREHALGTLTELAEERGIPVRRVSRDEFRRHVQSPTPQGVVAFARPLSYASLEALVRQDSQQPGFLLICDGVVDPHNLGALIRTADASGCDGVVIGKHRAVGITQTVLKASAGAAEYVPVAQVTNISRALKELKELGYWIAGATMDGELPLWDADFRGPTALVVGGEGAGLSRLVAETCDFLITIPMKGQVASLNASVAGAILMYEVVRQRTLVHVSK